MGEAFARWIAVRVGALAHWPPRQLAQFLLEQFKASTVPRRPLGDGGVGLSRAGLPMGLENADAKRGHLLHAWLREKLVRAALLQSSTYRRRCIQKTGTPPV